MVLIVSEESLYHCKMWRLHANALPALRDQDHRTSDWPIVVARGSEAVHARQPEAYVAAWIYTTNQWERPDRPSSSASCRTTRFWLAIEKDQLYRKDGYIKNVWDYSIDFTGPSRRHATRARVARETGHRCSSRPRPASGWRCSSSPTCRPCSTWPINGSACATCGRPACIRSWLFFGMFGSRAEELGPVGRLRARDARRDEFLRAMAVRDFGPGSRRRRRSPRGGNEPGHDAPAVHPLPTYYIGPSFLGPCHPLVPRADDAIPDVFHGYLYYLPGERGDVLAPADRAGQNCLVMDQLPATAEAVGMRCPGESDGWDIAVDEYAAAAAEARRHGNCLRRQNPSPEHRPTRVHLREETLLVELIHRTLRACENTLRFLLARREWERRAAMRRCKICAASPGWNATTQPAPRTSTAQRPGWTWRSAPTASSRRAPT